LGIIYSESIYWLSGFRLCCAIVVSPFLLNNLVFSFGCACVGGIIYYSSNLQFLAYVATKHAVSGITKSTALEYGRFGILSNAIAPGAILTPMVAEAFKQVNPEDPQAAEDVYAQANPTKRLGRPEEVGKLVVFLLSEDCSYVNGQVIAIDGGQSNAYGNV